MSSGRSLRVKLLAGVDSVAFHRAIIVICDRKLTARRPTPAVASAHAEATAGHERRHSPTIARLTIALVIFPHGAQKLFGWFGGHGSSWTMDFFGRWGFPAFLVVILILTESIGMISLALGFLGACGPPPSSW